MVKKIRFPLEMEQGVEVRSLEELRANFSLTRIMAYISNRKLVTWLRDRYADDIADAIEGLDINDSELPRKVCGIFDIEYDEDIAIDIEKAKERNRKLEILKNYTTEQKYLDVVSNIAFTQEDLYDLIDEQQNTIYLCGEKFTIPMSKKGVTYIGINNPIALIDAKEEVDWKEKKITLSDIRYDEKYQRIVDETKYSTNMNGYSNNSYINFMMSTSDREDAKQCYFAVSSEINNLSYDIDKDVMKIRDQIENAGIVGMAQKYIERL